MRFDQSQMGFRRGRGELRHDQAGGLQDQRRKGEHFHVLVFDVARVVVSVLLDVMHVFILCPCAVIIVSLSHDVPIHAFPLPDALPRPVSLSQPASFQPISLPVQPLPKRGAFQRSPPGVPRVQAGSGIHLFP